MSGRGIRGRGIFDLGGFLSPFMALVARITGRRALTLHSRSAGLTLAARSAGLTLRARSVGLTLPERQ